MQTDGLATDVRDEGSETRGLGAALRDHAAPLADVAGDLAGLRVEADDAVAPAPSTRPSTLAKRNEAP